MARKRRVPRSRVEGRDKPRGIWARLCYWWVHRYDKDARHVLKPRVCRLCDRRLVWFTLAAAHGKSLFAVCRKCAPVERAKLRRYTRAERQWRAEQMTNRAWWDFKKGASR